MSRLLTAITTATFLLTTVPAQAQEEGGFYIGGDLGYVFTGNTRSDGVFTSTGTMFDGQRLGPAPGQTAKGNFKSGLATTLIVGYDLGNRRFGRFRFEGELLHQNAEADNYIGELDGSDLSPPGRVDTTITGVTLNVLYDIGQFGRVQPYVHVGFGQGTVETKFNFPTRGQVTIDGTPSTGILQAGFGADIPVNERTSIDVKYRFRRAGLNENGMDTDVDAQLLQVGFRYAF